MKITYEDLRKFEPWSGAVETLERVREEGKLDSLESMLEELYPNGMTETQLNNLLWFDSESVFDWLGIKDEEDDQDDDDDDQEEEG